MLSTLGREDHFVGTIALLAAFVRHWRPDLMQSRLLRVTKRRDRRGRPSIPFRNAPKADAQSEHRHLSRWTASRSEPARDDNEVTESGPITRCGRPIMHDNGDYSASRGESGAPLRALSITPLIVHTEEPRSAIRALRRACGSTLILRCTAERQAPTLNTHPSTASRRSAMAHLSRCAQLVPGPR
jgi:hypothetical protein